MTLSRLTGISLSGLSGSRIEIEVDVSNGLPSYSLLGLPDATLNEARDRIRSAIINSGFLWPNKKLTISLSPAWLPKSGSAFDLPIALAILAASEQINYSRLMGTLFIGELSLEGWLRPVRGLLPMLIAAKTENFKEVVIPSDSFGEAAVLNDIKVVSLSKLSQVISYINGESKFENPKLFNLEENSKQLDFLEVSGQTQGKFALSVAAAGRHNILLIGSPGTGKTMLAERLPSILPPLTEREALEVAGIQSIAGKLRPKVKISLDPPYVAPHHATTIPALIGGGSGPIKPGACSLAHNGVLFIDEAPECATGILDALRQPMESGEISISRTNHSAIFPARFILALAANPCPCGKFAGRGRGCECSSLQVRKYLGKLSGPLLDRIDLRIRIEAPTRLELSTESSESSSTIRKRVIKARCRAAERFSDEIFSTNSQIPPSLLRNKYRATREGMTLLNNLLDQESITARSFHRILRTSWSIADLYEIEIPGKKEIELALSLRTGLGSE